MSDESSYGKCQEQARNPTAEELGLMLCLYPNCPLIADESNNHKVCGLHYIAAVGGAIKKRLKTGAYSRSLHWETQDGRRLAIEDMTDRHLVNTIKMLERAFETSRQYVDLYEYTEFFPPDPFGSNGWETGEVDLAREQEKRPVKDIYPIYEDLHYEAKNKRGLDWEPATKGTPRDPDLIGEPY